MRPGREHDTTALRAHAEALPLLTEWTDVEHAALADLGYEGERAALTTPIKETTDAPLTDDQRTVNLLHAATQAPAERGNSLLETTFKALRRISLCPWRIEAITAAGRDGHGLGNRLRAGSAPPPARPHYPSQAVTENGSLRFSHQDSPSTDGQERHPCRSAP